MSKDLTFAAIYKTNFVEGNFAKVVFYPIKVEFLKEHVLIKYLF